MNSVANEGAIQALVKTAVESYALGLQSRLEAQVDDPDGTLNMKIHNVFVAALGPEIQYYTALARSPDSSLGDMLKSLTVNIAGLFFDVQKHVEGPLSVEQTRGIAELLERYKRHENQPAVSDYQFLRQGPTDAAEGATNAGTVIVKGVQEDDDCVVRNGNRIALRLRECNLRVALAVPGDDLARVVVIRVHSYVDGVVIIQKVAYNRLRGRFAELWFKLHKVLKPRSARPFLLSDGAVDHGTIGGASCGRQRLRRGTHDSRESQATQDTAHR
jgi:hypothetical protein